MSTGKRALIVDDSRSARVILSRMLEQHGLAVDTAESAEQALEYLHQHRPDVIFMDHLMPGMDGFQAVQLIKGDAQTATIPLMMYTSQEGELYVSQARALGAVGVLPKTVRPVDVSRVLYQLHLLPDRRQDRTTLFQRGQPAEAARPDAEPATPGMPSAREGAPPPVEPLFMPLPATVSPAALSELSASLRQSLQQLLKDQLAEQRRFVLATFEAFARRLGSEMKEHAQKPPPAPAVVEPLLVEPPRPRWWPVIVTALLAVVPACVLGLLYWKEIETSREIGRQVSKLEARVGALAETSPLAAPSYIPVAPAPAAALPPAGESVGEPGPQPAAVPPAAGQPAPVSAPMPVEYVPYGDAPFGGTRLERLRVLASTLEAQRFRGRIVVEYTVGDFCLTGSPAEGFDVADPTLPLRKCDIVGNPFDDSLSPAQRQTVDFANFVATLRRRSGGAIAVDTVDAGRRSVVEYPEQTETTTAGAWNTIAAQNNRVEIKVVPAE
jgi:CheY-like chemotaxis protein